MSGPTTPMSDARASLYVVLLVLGVLALLGAMIAGALLLAPAHTGGTFTCYAHEHIDC